MFTWFIYQNNLKWITKIPRYICWRYMWTRRKCKIVWLKQVSVLHTQSVNIYIWLYNNVLIVLQSWLSYLFHENVSRNASWTRVFCLESWFAPKSSEGECASVGGMPTRYTILICFFSNPHNNYSINEKKNEQWKIKSYQLLTYTWSIQKK